MFFTEPLGPSLVCFWALLSVLHCVVGDTRERIVTPLLFQPAKFVPILAINLNFIGQKIYEHRGEIKFGQVTLMELHHCLRITALKEVLSNFWRRKTIF